MATGATARGHLAREAVLPILVCMHVPQKDLGRQQQSCEQRSLTIVSQVVTVHLHARQKQELCVRVCTQQILGTKKARYQLLGERCFAC